MRPTVDGEWAYVFPPTHTPPRLTGPGLRSVPPGSPGTHSDPAVRYRCVVLDLRVDGAIHADLERWSRPHPPLVLVGDAPLSAPPRGAAFVPARHALRLLPPVLLQVLIRGLFEHCFLETGGTPRSRHLPVLQHALHRALRHSPAVRPQSLVRGSPYSYKALQRAWARAFGGRSIPSRTRWLQAILFLRMVETSLQHPDWSWERVARTTGVTLRTLYARYHQFTGLPPGSADVDTLFPVVARLEAVVLAPLEHLAPVRWG